MKKAIACAALALAVGAAFFLTSCRTTSVGGGADAFVRARGSRFVVQGKPFRFAGANVAIMYRDEDRERMPETLAVAARSGIRVVRVWAFGEGGPDDVGPIADFADWPRTHPFRRTPG
ncbi:MAG TPA: hypothetical protein VJV03_01455, partial [Pyrinomonadaceae bacterium]|nr:hypothetical protein [Pyrinomonadaceae bacterium]